MSVSCPNKNLQSWKDLEKKFPTTAYYLWSKHDGNVDHLFTTPKFQKSLPIEKLKTTQQIEAKKIYFDEVYSQDLTQGEINRINNKLTTLSRQIGDVDWTLRMSKSGNYYVAGYKNGMVTSEDYYSPYASGVLRQKTSNLPLIADRKVLDNIVAKLSNRTGFSGLVISEQEAIELLKDTTPYKGQKAFFYNNTAYLVEGKISQDTPFHEFLHPFVEALYTNNREVFDRLYAELKSTDEGKALIDKIATGYSKLNTEDQRKEAMVTSVGKLAAANINFETGKPFIAAVKRILNSLRGLINKLFKSTLKVTDLDETTTLQTLADIFSVGSNKLDLTKEIVIQTPKFQKEETPYDNEELNAQILSWEERNEEPIPLEMRQSLEKQYKNKENIVLNEDKNVYEDTEGNIYDRATEWIKQNKLNYKNALYFVFGGKSDEYQENRDWGNIVNGILDSALAGLSKDDAIIKWRKDSANYDGTITEEVAEKFYDYSLKLIEKHKDAIITTQVPFASKARKIAGVADIVLTYKDGTIKILDLKTGKYSVYDNEFTKEYEVDGEKRASREMKFSAQLGLYRGLALGQDFDFVDDEPVGIIAAKLSTTGTEVTDVTFEGEKNITPIGEFVNYFIPERINLEIEEKAGKLIDKILIALKIRKDALVHTTTNKRIKENKLEELRKAIAVGEKIKSIEKYVDSVYEITVSNDNKYALLIQELEYKLKDLESGKITSQQAISELLYFKSNAETLFNINNDLDSFYSVYMPGVTGDTGTTAWKIQKIATATNKVRDIYTHKVIPLIAELLADNVSTDATERGYRDFKAAKLKWENAKKKWPNPTDNEKKKIQYYEDEYKKLKKVTGGELGFNKDVMMKFLEFGSDSDIGFIDRKLSNALQTSDPIVGTVANMIKKKFEDVRIQSLGVARTLVKALNNFRGPADNVEEYNRSFYKKSSIFYTDKKTKEKKELQVGAFVQALDEDAYNRALKEYKDNLPENSNFSVMMDEWYKNNYVKLSRENEVIVNPVTGVSVIITKGINTLLEEYKEDVKHGIISQSYYETLEKLADEYSVEALRKFGQPNPEKFRDEKYFEMIKDSSKKKLYDTLIATYFEHQQYLPENKRLGYILPSVPKNSADRIKELGVVEWLKYQVKSGGTLMATDYEYKRKNDKTIPILFSGKLDYNEVSLDLAASVAIFAEAALRYNAQVELKDFADTTLSLISKKTAKETDSLGDEYVDSVAEEAGVKDEMLKVKRKEFGNNNAALLLGSFIDMHIYGQYKTAAPVMIPFLGKVDAGKLLDSAIGAVSMTAIGGPGAWISGLTNYLNGAAQALIESRAKELFSTSAWGWAQAQTDIYLAKDAIKDWAEPMSVSLIGQLIELYNPAQKGFKESTGHRISQGAMKKFKSRDTWYFFMQMTEGKLATETMLAAMKEKKVKKGNEIISLFDAYELGSDGIIKLKDGVKLADGLLDRKIMSSIQSIHVKMNGAYDTLHKTDAERAALGRAFIMFKKYLVPGFKRRYKTYGFDQETGTTAEGYYRTFYAALWNDTAELVKYAAGMENTLTPAEAANIRRALTEQLIILTTGAVVMFLVGGMDDKEKKKHQLLLYILLKINSEFGLYAGLGDPQNFFMPNPKEVWRTIKNPTPLLLPIDRLFDVFGQLTHPTEVYNRNSGIWEKGDNKLLVKAAKFFGVSGTSISQENANKWMMMNYR